MESIVISVEKEIPKQRIADLLITAFEGGINYWCEIHGYLPPDFLDFQWDPDQLYKYVDYPLNDGGFVELFDSQEQKTHGLNITMIRSGLEVMSKKYTKHFNDFMTENEDATTGDVFIQCCVFGEVIYG